MNLTQSYQKNKSEDPTFQRFRYIEYIGLHLKQLFQFKTNLIIITSSLCFNLEVLAINPEVANIGYWYGDEDIRGVLSNRLGDSSYIAPAIPNNAELINDVAKQAIAEAKGGKPALIPVNLNNNHWTALAIRVKADGNVIVFFNDSLGGGISSSAASGEYIAAIRKLIPNAEIIDLQVRQQSDGSSCGAFTAENLIALASLPAGELNAADARAVLQKITDAKAIRLLHLNALSSLYQKLISIEAKANSKSLHQAVEIAGNSAVNDLGKLERITSDRVALYAASEISGMSSGDNSNLYGFWINRANSRGKYKAGSKTKGQLTTFGLDGKIDEETTLGLAISTGTGKLKNPVTDNSASTKALLGSLYGSLVLDDNLLISGYFVGGQFLSKSSFKSITGNINNLKLKGSITGASSEVSYYIGNDIFFIPALGASWHEVHFAKSKSLSLTIDKSLISRFSIEPSLRIMSVWNFGAFDLIPEVFGRVSWAGIGKAKEIIIRNNSGLVISKTSPKTATLRKEAGVSLTIASNLLELSAGIERGEAGAYLEHTGFMKLRVNV